MSVLKITKENFQSEVLDSKIPVLLDFWAEWCGPCRMVGPVVEEIANEKTNISVGKINVDEQPELASAFKVESIPMLVVVKDGKVTNISVGYKPKEQLINELGL